MAHNRYFIIDSDDVNLDKILSFSVESKDSARENNDKTKCVIKLKDGDHEDHPELSGYTEYDHDGILAEMQKPEWINDNL